MYTDNFRTHLIFAYFARGITITASLSKLKILSLITRLSFQYRYTLLEIIDGRTLYNLIWFYHNEIWNRGSSIIFSHVESTVILL